MLGWGVGWVAVSCTLPLPCSTRRKSRARQAQSPSVLAGRWRCRLARCLIPRWLACELALLKASFGSLGGFSFACGHGGMHIGMVMRHRQSSRKRTTFRQALKTVRRAREARNCCRTKPCAQRRLRFPSAAAAAARSARSVMDTERLVRLASTRTQKRKSERQNTQTTRDWELSGPVATPVTIACAQRHNKHRVIGRRR